jgi:hypothetical protein
LTITPTTTGPIIFGFFRQMPTIWDGQQGTDRSPPLGRQYPVLTGRLKNFPIVQQKTYRWLNALQKYGTGSPGTSTVTVPRSHIKTFLAENFCNLARGGTHFHGGPRRNTAIPTRVPHLPRPVHQHILDERLLLLVRRPSPERVIFRPAQRFLAQLHQLFV